jgi:hypothetical protein
VKIKGTCKRCGRTFMVEQVVDAGGECPWDGEPFSADYAVVLVDALRDAEDAGGRLERALEAIADLGPGFTLESETVLRHSRDQLDRLQKNTIRQG